MSASAQPIDAARFALAIEELPVEQIYAKAAELHNQIFHLNSSNEQLKQFADEGDVDCIQALQENKEVIDRINTRLQLLQLEVERRGLPWREHGENREQPVTAPQGSHTSNERAEESRIPSINGIHNDAANSQLANATSRPSGRLNDQQLADLLRARMSEQFDDEDQGVDL